MALLTHAFDVTLTAERYKLHRQSIAHYIIIIIMFVYLKLFRTFIPIIKYVEKRVFFPKRIIRSIRTEQL